ncbi:MAG: UDP-N-acetylglucosamine 4-epimerase [Patiriisocius sp.]|jgi:UDP-N-acetylglucosamine 4-epimerase
MIESSIISKIKDASFVITGGVGFIGSNIVEYLLRNKAKKVKVIDDLSASEERNIEEFKTNPAFSFHKVSITERDDIYNVFEKGDIVLHLAARGSVPRSIDTPLITNNVNINGFLNVLDVAREKKVDRVVFSSSSSVYGDNKDEIKVENRIGNPLSPYAASKRGNELYAKAFSNVYDLKIIGLRYFNVFGPKQNIHGPYAAVIPIFITNLLNNTASFINGDGSITRDFTFVQNVIEANVLAGFTDDERAFNSVFNIALGGKVSLNELYSSIQEKLGSSLAAEHRALRVGDILHSCADTNKAKEILRFKPSINLEDGLKITTDWYSKEHQQNR